MTGCGRFGIKVLLLRNQQSDYAFYVWDAILEDADHILAVSEDEEGVAEGGWGKRYTHSPLPPPPLLSFTLMREMWTGWGHRTACCRWITIWRDWKCGGGEEGVVGKRNRDGAWLTFPPYSNYPPIEISGWIQTLNFVCSLLMIYQTLPIGGPTAIWIQSGWQKIRLLWPLWQFTNLFV